MNDAATRRPNDFLRLCVLAAAASVVMGLLGWIPTTRVGGMAAAKAMGIGIAISLVASVIGAAVMTRMQSQSPSGRQTAMLASMALRMLVTLAGFGIAVFVLPVPRFALALWTGISYLCLLAIETTAVVGMIRNREASAR